jgi:LPPG:FO 2-phospho-L-lactate transferase
LTPAAFDVAIVAQKIVSKAEGRTVAPAFGHATVPMFPASSRKKPHCCRHAIQMLPPRESVMNSARRTGPSGSHVGDNAGRAGRRYRRRCGVDKKGSVPMTEVLALSGGVGGAKLAAGLQHVLPPGELTVAVNTGDDFEHLGLTISPDVDTVLYTLSGMANPDLGWGRAGDSWNFMAEIERLGGETWFRLGDKDLAIHIERTRRLAAGESSTSITADFARRFGILGRVVPMTDDMVRTMVVTEEGTLDFQHYFVARRCEPEVKAMAYAGAADARLPAEIEQLLEQSTPLQAIIICPSNPWLSIAPLLEIPAWRDALQATAVPVIAVSPLIGDQAVKGPTAKIMRELQLEVSSAAIAQYYDGVIDGFVLDSADAHLASDIAVATHVTSTLMKTAPDKHRLAREVLEFAQSFRSMKL